MQTNTTNTVEVVFDTITASGQTATDVVVSNAYDIPLGNHESPIEGYKKEYSIVGDALYASVSAEETPQWLATLIDNVVATSIANGMTNYDLLVQDVRNAIDSIDVAKNTFVEQINFDVDVDHAITTRLQTLNATLENTYATIIDLDTAVVNADLALTQRVTDLEAQFNQEINSQITAIQQALANADAALANNITALETAFINQEENLSGVASAVEGLQTYVGLNYGGTPNNTGLLAKVTQIGDTTTSLQNQLDGKVEYYFYSSYTGVPNALNEEGALAIIRSAWDTQALREANNGSVVYFKDTIHAYWYRASSNSWVAITDTSIYKALQEAANAKAAADGARVAADGKVSQFYAWGQPTAPANYEIVLVPEVLDENNNVIQAEVTETVLADKFKYWYKADGKLYYRPALTWVEVPTSTHSDVYVSAGDIVTVFDPATNDTTVYSYNGTSWEQTGPTGIISKSKFFVDLQNNVTGADGHVATSLSALEVTSKAYTDNAKIGVENKFAYNSTIGINNKYYTAGFGLSSTGVTQPEGADGTVDHPFSSEFWVNAGKFVLKNPLGGPDAVFTPTATGLVLGASFTEATRNVPRGTYVADTTYVTGDIVVYGGSSYIALKSTSSTPTNDGVQWQLLASQGTPGYTPIKGTDYSDGIQYYTWIKYSDNADGTGLYDTPTDDTLYIGIATNKTSATESADKADYVWSKFRGAQGDPGGTGPRGTAALQYSADLGATTADAVTSSNLATYWDAVAPTAYATEIAGDTLVVTNTSTTAGWTHIYKFNGTSWVSQTAFTVNGNMVVTGTLAADKLVANSITSSQLTTTGTLITTNAQMGTSVIDTANIKDLAVTGAKIKDLAVDTLKIKDYAVTVPLYVSTASAISVSKTAWVDVQSATITVPEGNFVFILASVTGGAVYMKIVDPDGVQLSLNIGGTAYVSNIVMFAAATKSGTYKVQCKVWEYVADSTIAVSERRMFLLGAKK